jgi:hypothetical protein
MSTFYYSVCLYKIYLSQTSAESVLGRLYLLSAYQEKTPARNAMYAHAQDFAASDELLLAILKAFI